MNQREKKRRQFNSTDESIDAEQIEKTLNFFDAILDPYLTDDDHHHPYPPSNVRRFTSENSLNHITTSLSTSTKPSNSRPLRTTATSTEDLTSIPSDWTKKLNFFSSNMVSASLIDLSAIDKTAVRPRFRFVPPSTSRETLKEEPELEHEYRLKTIVNDPPTKTSSSHQIVKPIVIIPTAVKSTPINRLIETHIHHVNGNSAFKPHRASQNGVSAKIQQQINRTESNQKSHVHMGKNPSESNNHPLRHLQSLPAHQSMLNLAPQTAYKSNGYPPQPPPPPPSSASRARLYDDPILRRIQQVNNSSSIHGLVHPENRPPPPQQQQSNYPYGSYLSPAPRLPNYYPPTKYPSSAPIYLSRSTGIPSSNIYHFHPHPSPRNVRPSKRQSHYQNATTITTYL